MSLNVKLTFLAHNCWTLNLKYSENVFVEKINYPNWLIRKIFTQVNFINGSNLSPPTIETIEVLANKKKGVTKKHMLLLPYQREIDTGLTKLLKRNLDKQLPYTLRRKLYLLVKKLAINLMLRI